MDFTGGSGVSLPPVKSGDTMSTNKKLLFLVGIPTNGEHSHFFTQFMLGTEYPTNFTMNFRAVPGYEVGDARNILVQEAINLGAKYLFTVDEDVIGPSHGIRQLFYRMETHPEWTVCAGLYATKTYPPEPLIFQEWGMGPSWDWKRGELIQVKSTGNGFNLYRVDDLKNMKGPEPYILRNPWDGTPMEVRRWFKTGKEYIRDENGIVSLSAHTEDSWFYSMCEDEGLQVWMDTSIICQHYDKHNQLFYSVPLDNDTAVKPDPWNHEPRVVNLGAGAEYNPHEIDVDLRGGENIDFRCDIRKLPEDWGMQFDIVKSNHVLEHFPYTQTEEILKEWYRLLKPGGKILLNVPDMQSVAQYLLDGDMDILIQGIIFGDQGNDYHSQPPYGELRDGRYLADSFENNAHKAGFTAKFLGKLLQKVGFVDISGERRDYALFLEAKRPEEHEIVDNRERSELAENSHRIADGGTDLGGEQDLETI